MQSSLTLVSRFLGELDEELDERVLAARLFAAVYLLALRTGKPPQWVIEDAFKASPSAEEWEEHLAPTLQASLGD